MSAENASSESSEDTCKTLTNTIYCHSYLYSKQEGIMTVLKSRSEK